MTRAAILTEFNAPLQIEEVTVNPPRAGEVLVQVRASGVCRTDLSVFEGVLPFPPPVVLGHEGAGVVEAVGQGVRHVKVGDRVVLAAVSYCGACHYCGTGKQHLCPTTVDRVMTGEENVYEWDGQPVARFSGVGSFSERTVVRASACAQIPDEVPFERACLLGCAVITGVGAVVNSANVQVGDTVAVFGCGGVGLNVIQGATIAGASRIIALDTSPQKLEIAKGFGATDVVAVTDPDLAEAEIREITGGLGVDYAFEVTGLVDVARQAFMALKRGGTAVVVGVPGFGEDISVPGSLLSLEERNLAGSFLGSINLSRDVPWLLDLYSQRRLKLDELVTQEVGLADINDAISALQSGDAVRSVIVYDI